MLIHASYELPLRVAGALAPGEAPLVTLRGLLDSGFALTDRRLYAWRANGAGVPLPVAAVERVLIDSAPGGDHLDVVILPRQAIHPPLVLTRRAAELTSTLAFVAQLAAAVGCEPTYERLGPIHRFSFRAPQPLAG